MEGLINKMKNIHRDPSLSPRGPAPGTAKKTSSKSHIPGGLLPGHGRMRSGPPSPRGGAASSLLNKRFTLPFLALLAVLTAGLLFLLPGGLLHAQEGMTELEYAENGMDPVATFTAVDPEGRTVYWDLVDLDNPSGIVLNDAGMVDSEGTALTDPDIADHGDFSISMDGVLTFKSPPSFESPNGGQLETDEETPANGLNTYKVVVVSSDDAPGATTDGMVPATDNLPNMAYHRVTVTVTDVDDDGMVTISAQQPQQGVALNTAGTDDDPADDAAAALKDQDASTAQITASKWKWEQSSAMDGPWTLISGATAASYTPAKDVAGMYLRVTVTYSDKHGDDKTAMAVSAHAVRAEPAGGNSAPVFSAGETDTRKVKENSPPGTAVGKPVTAGDAGDVLTYTLAGDDAGLFSIDRASGQIMTKASLNLEAGLTDRDTDTAGMQLKVTVRATDPYGDPDIGNAETENSDTITVDITVENVNESPKMTVGPTRDSQEENEDTDVTDGIQIPALTYTMEDVDANDTIRWSLEGADKDAFKVTPGTADLDLTDGVTLTATLAFKKSPNYEKPTDANMDNMYMVTVVATDAKKLTAMRDVVITVKNADDPGKITFSSEQPKVRIDFTATLTDEDDGVDDEKVKWQWAAVTNANCPDATFADDGTNDIDKAKSATYTPVTSPPTNVGQCLQATATYTDSNGSGRTTSAISANPVEDNLDNALPEFREGGDKPVTQAVRYIEENADDDAVVVVDPDGTTASTESPRLDLVMATDPNGSADVLTYTLGGRDEDSFALASDTGQITVKTGTKLDYEKKNSYMVTVTATDPSLASATIDVTINIVDVNEGPVIAGEDDITKEFRENLTSAIETFRATDPERRPVYWSLEQEDGGAYPDDGSLTIDSNGALRFKAKPDYETPGSDATDNAYTVVVVASDDAPGVGTPIVPSKRKFTVRVTNVIEQEQITVSPEYVEVNDNLTASLTPGDATTTDLAAAVWTWSGALEGTSTGETASITAPTTKGAITIRVTYRALGKDRNKSKSITVGAAPAPGTNEDPSFGVATSADVNEGRPAGTVVGTFVASDANSEHSGRLVYTLSDNTNFSINNSGRLTTKVVLDHETNPTLPLTITATDPSNGTGTLTITVTINDVDEPPTITTGPTRAADWPENKAIGDPVATYDAGEDPEGNDLVWSLTGTDASDFNIGNQEGGTPGRLTFKEMPDYEKPAASNNVYRVTVEVSDGKLKAMRPMTVKVTDVEEEGEVELSTVAPRVAVELTASLEDSDGGETDVTWQWQRDTTGGPGPDGTPTANCSVVADDVWEDIDEATSESYTPKAGDLGKCLRANASYTDRRGEGKTAPGVSDNAVRVNNDNRAPMFKENDVEITETTRKVAENVDAETPFGDGMDDGTGGDNDNDNLDNEEPVEATDPNGDTLTYTLSGTDAASFGIDRGTGQLMTKAKLDYETKNSYMVTVTATDPHGLSDSVDVTIMVTDMDEAPMIIVGGLVVTGTGDINYAENGMGMVAAYSAAGPDAADATWTLSGADAGDLSISSAGVLTFMDSPNYEMPMDANTDNIYMVMVNANDGTNDAMKTVSVRVTNEEDPGRVTFWRDGADATTAAIVVGDMLTGLAEDPDGNVGDTPPITDMYPDITGATWQWAKSMTPDMMDSWMDITGATDAAYMVMEGDNGYYLRATAMYTDGEGMGKMASEKTMMVTAVMEQMGEVTLWDGTDALTMAPQVGDTITGAVMDPDGGVTGETWQWSRTMTPDMMDSWMDIQDATEAAYMVTADDTGYHLRVMATYMDAVGTDTAMAYSPATMMVAMAEAGDSLMDRYDTSPRDGQLSLEEVFDGIDEYFDQTGPITLQEVNDLVDLYFDQS